jgi:hypothetical protein
MTDQGRLGKVFLKICYIKQRIEEGDLGGVLSPHIPKPLVDTGSDSHTSVRTVSVSNAHPLGKTILQHEESSVGFSTLQVLLPGFGKGGHMLLH